MIPSLRRAAALAAIVVAFQAAAQSVPLEELALRLLGGVEAQAWALTLLPGGLPDDSPVTLVWPQQARLVGSMVRRDPEAAILELEIVFDAPLSAWQATDAFRQALLAAGWREWLPPRPLGFSPQPLLLTALYCAEHDSGFLYLSAFQAAAPPADVRLEFFANRGYSPCLAPRPNAGAEPPSIPILLPPGGSEIINFGTQQALIDQLSSSALITTELTQAELFEHYERQLEGAGWQRQTRGESGTRDYSRWTLTDAREQVWTSLLSVVEIVEEPGHYFVAAVVLVPADAQGADR